MAEKKFTLRLPEDMHAALNQMADEEIRSLHSMVIVILREAIERRQAQSKEPAPAR
ncbi:MAG TPA: Arc family DNA-binding protein [Herpetosiphonaceae bacterium]|nr:Arc family DNA-binding protein [Herpetosiphonaceae bacterium]